MDWQYKILYCNHNMRLYIVLDFGYYWINHKCFPGFTVMSFSKLTRLFHLF